jgi:hypothetical protein
MASTEQHKPVRLAQRAIESPKFSSATAMILLNTSNVCWASPCDNYYKLRSAHNETMNRRKEKYKPCESSFYSVLNTNAKSIP